MKRAIFACGLLILVLCGQAQAQIVNPNGGGGGGGGSPTGAAGGGLTGTYPNPGLSTSSILAGISGQAINPQALTSTNTWYAETYSGATWDVKVASCLAALPSTGGVCDATGLIGAQTGAASVTIPANDTLLVGKTTLTMASGAQILLSNSYSALIGQGVETNGSSNGPTLIIGTVAGAGVIQASGTSPDIESLSARNTDATDASSAAIEISGALNWTLKSVHAEQGTESLVIGGASYYGQGEQVDVSASSGQIGLFVVHANSIHFNTLIASGGATCLSVEATQGVSINHFDCEGSTGNAVQVDYNSGDGGSSNVQIWGGYFQLTSGYVTAIGSYIDQSIDGQVIYHDTYIEGSGSGLCTGQSGSNPCAGTVLYEGAGNVTTSTEGSLQNYLRTQGTGDTEDVFQFSSQGGGLGTQLTNASHMNVFGFEGGVAGIYPSDFSTQTLDINYNTGINSVYGITTTGGNEGLDTANFSSYYLSGTAFTSAVTTPIGTSGPDLGLLNANLTFGGNDTFSNAPTMSGANIASGTIPNSSLVTPITLPITLPNGGTNCDDPTNTFAGLPASPAAGTSCYINDSASGCTAGTAVTAGGLSTPCTITYLAGSWYPGGGVVSAASGGVASLGVTAPIKNTGSSSAPVVALDETANYTWTGTHTFKDGVTNSGGVTQAGSIASTQIGTPSAPSIVSGFSSGTTDYYFCVAEDVNGPTGTVAGTAAGPIIGATIPSSGTGTTGTTGTMSCGGKTGALTYALLRKTSSSVPSGSGSFLVGTCTATSGNSCNIADAGNTLTTFIANTTDTTNAIAFLGQASPWAIYENGASLDIQYYGSVNGFFIDTVGDITARAITANSTINSSTFTIVSTTGAIGPTGGGVLQSYGGTVPTASAASGTVIVLAPSTCTGSGTPFACCTGPGAGATCPISTNTAGQISLTGGTSVTSITLTFSASGAYHLFPTCEFTDASASITPAAYSTGAVSTTTAVVDFVATSAAVLNYICIGH